MKQENPPTSEVNWSCWKTNWFIWKMHRYNPKTGLMKSWPFGHMVLASTEDVVERTSTQVDTETPLHTETHTCIQYLCWRAGCLACLLRVSCERCSWTRRSPELRSHWLPGLYWCGRSPPSRSAPRTCSVHAHKHTHTHPRTHTEREINPEQADSRDCDVLQIALSHPISHIKEALNRYLHSERQSMKCTKSGFSGEMARTS